MSLGVDLIPPKTCTYNCLYCQLGSTKNKTLVRKPYVETHEVMEELRRVLRKSDPDAVTLAGSGEPTLHSEIGEVIDQIKSITETRIALLTNGSLFWEDEVRQKVLHADIIMPTLSSASEETFRLIHRPAHGLDLARVVDGLRKLRKDYEGRLWLEVVLLAGINDSERELEGLRTLIQQLRPDRIQLNTVVRPPADARAMPVSRDRLDSIKAFFGRSAQVIADVSPAGKREGEGGVADALMDMVRRRPLRSVDIAKALGISIEDAQRLVKGLLMKGNIISQEHFGEIYYRSHEKDVRE